MNLITDRWIPVRRIDGSLDRVAPCGLTDRINDNQIVAVASPRPDFDGALTQFLIGLLQTTSTPDAYAWRLWRKNAPSTDELRARFEVSVQTPGFLEQAAS
jgi:CRISPR system Cascade subunit CasA